MDFSSNYKPGLNYTPYQTGAGSVANTAGSTAGGALGGMFGGPWGAALGTTAGAALMQLLSGLFSGGPSISEAFGGKAAETKQSPLFNPQQQQAFSSILQQALGGLGQNKFDFAPIERHARTQFQEQTIPSLAERFTSMGGSDTRLGSGAFGQALSSAGAGLEQGLVAQHAGYNLQQQQLLQGLLGLGMTPQFETAYRPRERGFLETGAQSLMSATPLMALLGSGYGQAQGQMPTKPQ